MCVCVCGTNNSLLLLLANSPFVVVIQLQVLCFSFYTPPSKFYCCFNSVIIQRALSQSRLAHFYSNNKHTNNKKTRIYLLAFATLSNSSFFLIA